MDNELDILIRVKADLAAAQATVAELKELKRQAVAAGVSTGDLDQQIAAAERTQTGAGKKLEEQTKKNTEHTGHLGKAVKLLTNQFGELGHLSHFALSLPALGIAALAVGIGLAVEKFKQWREHIEAAALELQKLNQAKLDGVKAAMDAGKISTADLIRELAAAGKQVDTLKEKFNQLKAAYDAAGIGSAADPKELAERRAKQEGKDMRALAAEQAVQATDKDPQYQLAVAGLAAATAKTEALTTAERQARGKMLIGGKEVTLEELRKGAATEYANGGEGGVFAQILAEVETPIRKLAENTRAIATAESVILSHGLNKAGLAATAAALRGDATANTTRVNELEAAQAVASSGRIGGNVKNTLGIAQELAGLSAGGTPLNQSERAYVTQVAGAGAGQSVDFNTAVKALLAAKKNEATNTKMLERMYQLELGQHSNITSLDARLAQLERLFRNVPTRP